MTYRNPHPEFDHPYADPGICCRHEAVLVVLREYGYAKFSYRLVIQTLTGNARMRNADIVMHGQL